MSPADTVARVEAELHAFYLAHHVMLGDRGYRLMFGPALRRPPALFLGYQPGGTERTDDHRRPHFAQPRPAHCLYATATWPMARQMRAVFGAAFLQRCTGLNAILVRSPSVATYRREVPVALRRAIRDFCVPRVEAIVAACAPATVVGLGFESLRVFAPVTPILANARGRMLLVEGRVGDTPAIGMLHPSGAWFTRDDRAAIAAVMRDRLSIRDAA